MFAELPSDINSHKSRLLHLTGQPYCKKISKNQRWNYNLFLRNNLIDRYNGLLVGTSIYSKSSSPKEPRGMFQNILLAEYHVTFHDTP
jgi:hypothetical protein